MKKLLAIIFVMALALSLLTACGGSISTPSGNDNTMSSSDKTTPPPSETPNQSQAVSNDPSNNGSPTGYFEAIPFIYDQAGPFSEGLAAVQSGGRWGYIDKDGNEVIRCILDFEEAYPFSGGMARVFSRDYGWGLIDRMGNLVEISIKDPSAPTPAPNAATASYGRLQLIDGFSEGLAAVCKDGLWGYIDTEGNVIIPFIYTSASPFYDGLACVNKEEDGFKVKSGYIDKAGNEVIPIIYDHYGYGRGLLSAPSPDGLFLVILDGKIGFVDRAGNEVIPLKFTFGGDDDRVGYFNDGMAPIVRSGAWGFIDKQGNEVIPPQYVRVEHFSEGLAMVEYKGMVGFVDRTGNEVIPLIYSYSGRTFFSEGLAMVLSDAGTGFIDKTGNVVIPFGEYIFLSKRKVSSYFSEGLAAAGNSDGKWGFLGIK